MQTKDKSAGIAPASKHKAGSPASSRSTEGTALVLPQFLGVRLLDPNIIYCIQLANAAADQLFHTNRILEAVEPEKYCGYDSLFEDLGKQLTSVVDSLIDFAGKYAKMSL